MSQAKAMEFLTRAHSDPKLLAEVRKAQYDALQGIARKAGFEFSFEDYIAALDEAGQGGRKLSDNELDQVSGGTQGPFC